LLIRVVTRKTGTVLPCFRHIVFSAPCAFVDHVVGAWLAAAGVLYHGGFMVGSLDAYGSSRGDAITGRVVFAYSVDDGAYRSP
jgi:hypothetical protein